MFAGQHYHPTVVIRWWQNRYRVDHAHLGLTDWNGLSDDVPNGACPLSHLDLELLRLFLLCIRTLVQFLLQSDQFVCTLLGLTNTDMKRRPSQRRQTPTFFLAPISFCTELICFRSPFVS